MKYPQVQVIIDILSRIDNSASSKLAFDMSVGNPKSGSWHKCGTACCIGGWANRALYLLEEKTYSIETALCRLTGIPREDSDAICYPEGVDWDSISLKVALKCLGHYRDTGEVLWRRAGAKKE
jgi:hypothetical protein